MVEVQNNSYQFPDLVLEHEGGRTAVMEGIVLIRWSFYTVVKNAQYALTWV